MDSTVDLVESSLSTSKLSKTAEEFADTLGRLESIWAERYPGSASLEDLLKDGWCLLGSALMLVLLHKELTPSDQFTLVWEHGSRRSKFSHSIPSDIEVVKESAEELALSKEDTKERVWLYARLHKNGSYVYVLSSFFS